MANIVVTKDGELLKIVYNNAAGRFDEYSRNMRTGHNVALLTGHEGVETSILCKQEIIYTNDMFDTVDSGAGVVNIATNKSLYDELVKFL